MDAFDALRAFADRFRDWRLNSDHTEIEDDCAKWAESLLSRHANVDVITFVLDDIESYMALRSGQPAARRLREDFEQSAGRLQQNPFGQLELILLGFIMNEPEYGRQYLARRVEADDRIDTAIRLRKSYGLE